MLRKRRERRETPGRFKLHKAPWTDPFPWIPGTEPEKRIFKALVERRIYFRYQANAPADVGSVTVASVMYIPDFALPEYRCVIDPFSPFHHSLAGAEKRDARKIGLFLAAGWEYYHPWALDNGMFSLDQPQHDIALSDEQGKPVIRFSKGKPRKVKVRVTNDLARGAFSGLSLGIGQRPKLGGFVQTQTFSVRDRERAVGKALGGDLSGRYSASELLWHLPLIAMGTRYELTDPEDIEAKRLRGYLLGSHLGAGATSVAAANRRRRVPKALLIRRLRP